MTLHVPTHPVRIVTAASLFDGHDAAINVMRRIMQAQGCEVIHLGHDRSVLDVVDAAIQEDVQAIAVSSYQGGHVEYFGYLVDSLRERGAGHVRIGTAHLRRRQVGRERRRVRVRGRVVGWRRVGRAGGRRD